MVKAAEIEDRETLGVWLRPRSRGSVAQIAARAALRFLPVWASDRFMYKEIKDPSYSVLVLRALLFSELVGRNWRDLSFRKFGHNAMESLVGFYEKEVSMGRSFSFISAEAASTGLTTNDMGAARMYAVDVVDGTCEMLSFPALEHDIWEAVRRDSEAIEQEENAFTRCLWHDVNPVESTWGAVCETPDWSGADAPYDFWRRWYQSLLDGEKVFPDQLLHDIATLPDDLWKGEDAPQKIAAEIRRLEEKHRLEAEIKEARAAVKAAQEEIKSLKAGVAPPAQRSGNYPPDMQPLDVEFYERDLEEADAALEAAETEIKKPNPAAKVLLAAAKALGKAALAIARYCGQKADKVVDTALEEGIKQVVKWGIRVGGVAFADQLLGVSKLIEAFAKNYPFP